MAINYLNEAKKCAKEDYTVQIGKKLCRAAEEAVKTPSITLWHLRRMSND